MLLTANVSLLAIQSIDNVKGEPSRSLAQIAAYVSLLLSLANYITCQILLRQHRRIINSNAVRLMPYSVLLERNALTGFAGLIFPGTEQRDKQPGNHGHRFQFATRILLVEVSSQSVIERELSDDDYAT